MIDDDRTLVVGIGSPHGDDQAGWWLIERLSSQVSSDVELRTASVPHNLIDWSERCGALHIVDAYDSGATVMRFELSDETSLGNIESLTRCQSSHQFGIAKAIELGQVLGKVPSRIVVWAIPGVNFGPGQSGSQLCRQQVDRCAELLSRELARGQVRGQA